MDLLPNIAFAINAVSFAVRDIIWLRGLAIVASLTAICYELQQWHSGDLFRPANLIWHSLFVVINGYQLWVLIYGERRVRFRPEEEQLYQALFRGLTRLEFARLLKLARWEEAAPGTVLATQDTELTRLLLVFSGTATVVVDGRRKADVHDGEFVGEMSFTTGGPATATVQVTEPTRYLSWDRAPLRQLLNRRPHIHLALDAAMNVDLSRKLRRGAGHKKD